MKYSIKLGSLYVFHIEKRLQKESYDVKEHICPTVNIGTNTKLVNICPFHRGLGRWHTSWSDLGHSGILEGIMVEEE